ncbi:uncharacterized protein LOC120342492 [Styela clava]
MKTNILCCIVFLFVTCHAYCPAEHTGELPPGVTEDDLLDPNVGVAYNEDSPDLPEELRNAITLDELDDLEPPSISGDILENSKSMQEIMDATTSKEFLELFGVTHDQKVPAMELLKFVLEHTKIIPGYLTNVFSEVTKVNSQTEFEEKMYDENGAMILMSNVLNHFQQNPYGGRPKSEDLGVEEKTKKEGEAKNKKALEDEPKSTKKDEPEQEQKAGEKQSRIEL